jgi:malonyl-CoA decarboxylase
LSNLPAPKSKTDLQPIPERAGRALARFWDGLASRGRTLRDRRQLQTLTDACETLHSELGEFSGVALARQILERFAALRPEGKLEFFSMLAERFGSDAGKIDRAIRAYFANPDASAVLALHDAAESRRQELIRRLNFAPSGTAGLLRMREDLLQLLPKHPELKAVDADFEHLFRSWFNRGFLQMHRIDWHTPAVILERIIHYEAVHEISGWADLRRRLDPPDRRCFAFFHPTLADDPLIFVEVALTDDIPSAIAPLLADGRAPIKPKTARTAVFYSISNCQRGLRGVSFGNFLIKQVAEDLKREFPRLNTFVTLSPVPGFTGWLRKQHPESEALRIANRRDWHLDTEQLPEARQLLEPLLVDYLLNAKNGEGRPLDPVARFHLDNGASVEHIRWLGDVSEKGLRNNAGFMVNYLYDLDHVVTNHEAHVKHGTIIASRHVRAIAQDGQ